MVRVEFVREQDELHGKTLGIVLVNFQLYENHPKISRRKIYGKVKEDR